MTESPDWLGLTAVQATTAPVLSFSVTKATSRGDASLLTTFTTALTGGTKQLTVYGATLLTNLGTANWVDTCPMPISAQVITNSGGKFVTALRIAGHKIRDDSILSWPITLGVGTELTVNMLNVAAQSLDASWTPLLGGASFQSRVTVYYTVQ